MHRLQISLPLWQFQFLSERARRAGIIIAEVIRQLIQREVEAASEQATSIDSIWEIVGIAEDHGPLMDGIPVSEAPDLYQAELAVPSTISRISDNSKD